MRPPRTRPGILFRLLIPATAVFIVTVLAMTTVAFFSPSPSGGTAFGGRPSAVSDFFDQHGMTILLWELGVVMCLIFAAMTYDRIMTLRGHESEKLLEDESTADSAGKTESDDSNTDR